MTDPGHVILSHLCELVHELGHAVQSDGGGDYRAASGRDYARLAAPHFRDPPTRAELAPLGEGAVLSTTEGNDMNNRIPIIICSGANGRSVLYGYVEAEPVEGKAVVLHDARMVLYWSRECGGLLGLAAKGPRTTTRITAAVTKVADATWKQWVAVPAAAAKEMDAWPAC